MYRNAATERTAVYRVESLWLTSAISCAIIIASPVVLIRFFPLPMNSISWTQTITAYNKVIAPISFSDDPSVKTVVVSVYPNVLYGDVDAVCRGAKEIFGGPQSPFFEKKFGNFACITDKQRDPSEFAPFNHIVFRNETSDQNLESAIQRLEGEFPYFSKRITNCVSIKQFTTFGVTRCDLAPAQ